MQQIRYKSILKTLRWTINLALILEVAMTIFAIVLMLVAVNSDEKLVSGWSALLPAKSTAYNVDFSEELETASAAAREVNIQFSTTRNDYYLLKFIETIFIFSIVIWITIVVGKIIGSLHRENAFTGSNAKHLRHIAILVAIFTPFSIVQSLIYRNYISKHISIEGKTFVHSLLPKELASNEIWLDFQINVEYLFIGALLLILAEIFRIGLFLKTDNESIV